MSEAIALTAKAIGGKSIIFKELTVADIRALSVSTREHDLISETLFEQLSVAEIPFFTSLDAAEIEEMKPSDIQKVIDGCMELNPHFFKMLARLSQGSKA